MLLETVGTFARLWSLVARVIVAKGHVLLLLFLLGWAGYHVTTLVCGMVAPYHPWLVFPLMGLGCLTQLTVTLVAYRTSIESSGDTMGLVREERMNLVSLLSTMLVPFAAAYSAFGFMAHYAKDAMLASDYMLGDLAHQSFLVAVNPINSRKALITAIVVFVALWLAARGVKALANKTHSSLLSLFSTFLSSISTFIVLFSFFRVYEQVNFWMRNREFMAWRDGLLRWLGDLVNINLPTMVDFGWTWLADTGWPIFWNALSQPILWLGVVSLVGGTSLKNVSALWTTYLERSATDPNQDTELTVIQATRIQAAGFVRTTLLPYLRNLGVILKSGVPFLCTLIVSYAGLEWVKDWLTYVINKGLGPLDLKWVFLLLPVQDVVPLALMPCVTAVLLAVAYTQLKRIIAQEITPTRPRNIVTSIVAVLISLAIAIGLTTFTAPSPDKEIEMSLGTPAMIMANEIRLSDVRIGRFLTMSSGYGDPEILFSRGVFVVVTVDVYTDENVAAGLDLLAHGVDYTPLSGLPQISSSPGFTTSRDVVFEVPLTAIDDLTLRATTRQTVVSTLAWGVLRIPSDTPIDRDVSASSVVRVEAR